MPQALTLIEPTTLAATVDIFVAAGEVMPLTVSGISATENIAVQIMTPAGYAQYFSNGVTVQLSTTTNKLAIDLPGRYRLVKPVTVAVAGVLKDQS